MTGYHIENSTFAVTSKGLLRNNAHLSTFLAASKIVHVRPRLRKKMPVDAVLAWGNKPSAATASSFAAEQNLPLLRLEDGFLRSLDGGITSRHACSMVVDDIGIYFDAHRASRLESIICETDLTTEQEARAHTLINTLCDLKLSKYNLAPEQTLNSTTEKNILVIDQTHGDQSVVGAGATADSFQQMLQTAIADHPDATIWVKTHPQSAASKKKHAPSGYFSQVNETSRIKKITSAFNPISLIQQVDAVYVVSSHMGFEALICGKTVHCFGVPWYAGWGLTKDDNAPQELLTTVQQRRGISHATLVQLFYAAYIAYTRYVNPATGNACEIEDVMQWLTTNRHWQQQLSATPLAYFKPSAWKLSFLDGFLCFPNVTREITYFRYKKPASKQKTAIAWGKRQTKIAQPWYSAAWCMEDGFVRSRGLGAALVTPLSIVIDKQGIYFDPAQPSDIEQLCHQVHLSEQQKARTQALIDKLIANQISKYNVGSDATWPTIPENKPIILVPGQVEDDASVQLSMSAVKTNLELLTRVRQLEPDAFIIYKPHPDVVAKLRTGDVLLDDCHQFADAVVTDISMPQCLARVDAVHTISSLTGFEALLRGKAVTCHGLPFYAGWGLTTDRISCPRRNRQLTLLELVYVTLVSYPMYRLPEGHGLAEIEQVIHYLETPTQSSNRNNIRQYVMQLRYRLLAFISRLVD